jgi:hypothetical protein
LRVFLATAEVFGIELHCSRKDRAQRIYNRLMRFRYETLTKADTVIGEDSDRYRECDEPR